MDTLQNKKKFYILVLLAVLLLLGIGYAYLTGNLSINGDALIKRNTWNIHWVNPPTVSSGSVSGASVTAPAHVVGTNNDTVEYSVTLNNPRDYYEFTVTAENTGTMDAMISTISNNVYLSSDMNNTITLPSYLNYTITYSDGVAVAPNQLLNAGSSETFKVRLYYRDDIDVSVLPSSDQTLSFRFNVTYVQADSNAVPVPRPVSFANDSWDTIISAAQTGNTSVYTVGSTKTVDMGALGTHTLRVANNSTPSECSNTGFSETACGFVLEFADLIGNHVMNSTNTNVGGWPSSSMRTYINTDLYNSLPVSLKNAVIDTRVVSGHGDNSGETNFVTTDKLYLLSPMEIWGNNITTRYDSARDLTRQLDYYSNLGVNNLSYSSTIKQFENLNLVWWLRSPTSNTTTDFAVVYNDGSSEGDVANYSDFISPAFRLG